MSRKKAAKSSLPLLDQVVFPEDFRGWPIEKLVQLAEELREETINTVSKIGGHLGAGLGVVELTIALHYVFNTPVDQLIWDVGHQGYPHKIITGRRNQMNTLRQSGGISGFLKRSESPYDAFGAGHSSTSISAALGMAAARDINKENFDVVTVIGDGALTAGMAYEAMNNAGHSKCRFIVILNDNEMSIAPNVGAMNKYLNRLMSSKSFLSIRSMAKNVLNHMPCSIENFARKTTRYAKDVMSGGNFFEEMGFHYIGPLNGHDLNELVPILSNIKEDHTLTGPILVHIKTQKGKGFNAQFSCGESYHAVQKFDPVTRVQQKSLSNNPTYTKIFGQILTKMAAEDDKIVAITAAMPSGTGVNIFSENFPDRTFDVGIAEQHAVTFAAGLSTQGIKPFVAIYSTFLQRAYDQVVHDVALQYLPVRFIIDRAGLVGADGPTHAGFLDLVYLCSLPGIIVMAPSSGIELARMVVTAGNINHTPCAIRFPRGEAIGTAVPAEIKPLTIGKGNIIQKGSKVAVLSLGTRLGEVQKAAIQLENETGLKITIADARFAKPLDEELIKELAASHEILITIEEGAAGGFGSHVAQYLLKNSLLNGKLKFKSMFLPDEFIEQGLAYEMYENAGLNSGNIIKLIKELINEC